MTQHWKFLAAVILSGCAAMSQQLGGPAASGGGGGGMTGGGVGGGGDHAVWKQFVVQDLMLGTRLSTLAAKGFTCGPDKGNSMPTCVKILDERCKDRKITVRAIAMNFPPPEGRGCVYDAASGSTLLDHEQTTTPMSLVAVKGTDTRDPRAYEITFDFAMNILGDDTKLGKALIAKYGKPELVNAPSQLAWTSGDVQLQAICGTSTADWGKYCYLSVTDNKLLETERSVEAAAKHEETDARSQTPKL